MIRVNINVDVASAVPKAPDVIGQVLQIGAGPVCVNVNLNIGRVLAEVGNAVFQILNIGLRPLGININVDVCGAFAKAADVASQFPDTFLGLVGICVYGDVCAISTGLEVPDVTRQIADVLGCLFSISDDVHITRSLGPQCTKHPHEVTDTCLGLFCNCSYGYAI